ncbi:MAG: Asp-tRNA(Asn)/Glu-tRNA(Gln) amidotransferase subunit GatA [Chitinispirillaceae bacterium]|nr:Asp-tRNA(Asn)/Glu-tRNA(Gln) amidotransferase subunit GatA [Chitinispirillaceae bacterium]
MPFFDTTIAEAARAMAAGEMKCSAVAARAIDTIKRNDPSIHSFITLCDDRALLQAERLDALTPTERQRLPLCGIPIAVKDNLCVKGVTATCGSKMLARFEPPYNATVIDALQNAGAVIVGKTNMDEFAMGSSTESSAFGVTRNPVSPNRIPGGSSGGSAAAVAAGMVPAALGSDTGGSIRQPCSHCGCVGLKPSYGRVSRYGLVAFASSLDQIGPMASDVRDIGALLEVLSTPDPLDSTNGRERFSDDPSIYSGDLSGMTVGLPREYFAEGLDDGVRAALMRVLDGLAARGAATADVSLPNVKSAIAAYYIICTAEASSNLARYDGVRYGHRAAQERSLMEMYTATREEGFGAEVKRRIMIGTYVLSSGYYDAYYLKAARVRTLIAHDFEEAFKQCDVILSPVSPTPAFNLGEKTRDPLQMYLTDIYTVSANLAGIPGISVPAGAHDGLPVGAQFMAPQWHEASLLKAAFAAQLSNE